MGGEETDELEKLIDEFDAARVRCLVVNLVDVGMMNSLSIGRLVRGHLKFKKRNARMHLCNVDAKLINVFVITKLSIEFNVFASEDAAVQGCGEKPEAGAP